MRIGDLCGPYRGQDLYIIGTGPSVRFFPWHLLDGKITIGLNQAYRHMSPRLSITAHPELVVEYEALRKARDPSIHGAGTWIVKRKPPMQDLQLDDKKHYVYNTREDWGLFGSPEPDTLFLGRGIQCTAVQLAAQMGARSIMLIGVDMGSPGGDHHGHDQHIRSLGLPMPSVYNEYHAWLAKSRRLVRQYYGIPILQLSALLGVEGDRDYNHLCRELDLADLPKPVDTSSYRRQKTDDPGL